MREMNKGLVNGSVNYGIWAFDAVIVSDPALIEICATYAPGLNIHLSTQASATNVETFHFWKEYGLTRVVFGP